MDIAEETRPYAGVTTASIVESMLKEDTGTHFLDSGSAYGRSWQRNQGKDFAAEPAVTCEWNVWRKDGEAYGELDVNPTISLYHWMVHNLEFDAEMQAELEAFSDLEENESMRWLEVQAEFAEYITKRDGSAARPKTVNTYNFEQDLSQVLQYTEVFTEDGGEPSHLIVSVHGGADVRDGYGSPKCFRVASYWEAMDTLRVKDIVSDTFHWEYAEGWSRPPSFSDPVVRVPDVLHLPSLKPEWVESEVTQGLEASIALCTQQIKDLKGATLDSCTQAAHQLALAARIKELTEELLWATSETAQEQFGDCVIVTDDGRAFLCLDDEPLEMRATSPF